MRTLSTVRGVRLTLPASTGYIGFARALGSTIGEVADLRPDQVDDLRIAIDEACVVLVGRIDSTGPLELTFEITGDIITIEGSCPLVARSDVGAVELSGLQAQILEAVTDDHEFFAGEGVIRFRLRTRR